MGTVGRRDYRVSPENSSSLRLPLRAPGVLLRRLAAEDASLAKRAGEGAGRICTGKTPHLFRTGGRDNKARRAPIRARLKSSSDAQSVLVRLLAGRAMTRMALETGIDSGSDRAIRDQWSSVLEGTTARFEWSDSAVYLARAGGPRSEEKQHATRKGRKCLAGAPRSRPTGPDQDWIQRSETSPLPLRPVATAEARVIHSPGSRNGETAEFDWSLADLSAGIKRILNEEARRHGIDV